MTRLISLVNHHLGNRADRIYSEVNVYTQVVYMEVGVEGVGTKSSMFYLFMFMNFSTAEETFKCKELRGFV